MYKTKRENGRSDRMLIIDLVKDKPPETIVGYDELGAVLGFDPVTNRNRIQGAVRLALKTLLAQHRRGLGNISGVGYRVLQAREHALLSDNHRTKAARAINTSVAFLDGTRREELTEAERRNHDQHCLIMQALVMSHDHLDRRLRAVEKLLRGGVTIQHE